MANLRLRNPRTGADDGMLAMTSDRELAALAGRLRSAQQGWTDTPIERRCAALLHFADALQAERALMIDALLRDTGRWHESMMEVDAVIATLRRWAAEAAACLGEPTDEPSNVGFVEIRQRFVPYALVGVISPWNFPLLLSLIDAIPALAAGCAVLVKPSEITPRFVAPLRTALATVPELESVLALVVGDGLVGNALLDQVDLVCFTGSVRTGRRVGEAAAARIIPAFLELGGKNPAIVLAGTDVERAARAICWAGFVSAGQSCMSIERAYVEASIATQFTDALVAHTHQLKLAHPHAQDGEIGPIISAAQIGIVREHLREAKARGARALSGGAVIELDGGSWCPPTVLVDVEADMKVVVEESFAAILPVIEVANADAAIAAANASPFGLCAAVFAATLEEAERIAVRLRAGAVSLNDASLTSLIHTGEKPSFSFSGLGGSRMEPASIRRFVRPQALLVNPGVDSTIEGLNKPPPSLR